MAKDRQTVNIRKNAFEMDAWQKNCFVVGIDEVGRGCLAGPVVAAAVILPINKPHRILKDSKVMTSKEREIAAKWIKKHCFYGIGIIHHRLIDEHNIRQATFMAMKKALLNVLEKSKIEPSVILVDAMPLDVSDTHIYNIPIRSFPFGEKKSSSIAAASTIAKVTRDAMMNIFDITMPGYVLQENKGYGTAEHIAAIYEKNYSILHRVTFLSRLLQQKQDEKSMQQAIDFYVREKCVDEAGEIFCGSN